MQFLRAVSPVNRKLDSLTPRTTTSKRMVVRNGEVVELDSLDEGIATSRTFRDQRVTSDQIERHHKLLRRQYFMEVSEMENMYIYACIFDSYFCFCFSELFFFYSLLIEATSATD